MTVFASSRPPSSHPLKGIDVTKHIRDLPASRWGSRTTFFGGLVAVARVLGPEYAHLLLRAVGKPRGGNQQKRRITLAHARLNRLLITLGVWADDPRLPPSTGRPTFGLESGWGRIFRQFRTLPRSEIEAPKLAGQDWYVADDPDIAEPRRRETHECDAIARTLMPAETERDRIASLNARHEAVLDAITGKTIEPPPRQMRRHYAADMAAQIAAGDMMFEDVGRHLVERRDRENDLLDATEKVLTKGRRKGKPYRPNKAGPGQTLTGQARAMALADMVVCIAPAIGRQRTKVAKPYPRGDEPCLFDKCRRAGRKELRDYMPRNNDDTIMYRQWDLLGTRAAAGFADRHRLKPLIDVPEGWSRNSYAEELMTYSAKARIKDKGWGAIPFVKVTYHSRSLNSPFWD
jgi:hypothetical protein